MAATLSFKKVRTAKPPERDAVEWHWMHLGILECEWCRLGFIVKTALSCPLPVPLRCRHVASSDEENNSWLAKKSPSNWALTAQLSADLNVQTQWKGNFANLQTGSNKCLPYRTSVQYLDTSAAQAAICVPTGMLQCFFAVIQTPKWECTPCSVQWGHLLPVMRK